MEGQEQTLYYIP